MECVAWLAWWRAWKKNDGMDGIDGMEETCGMELIAGMVEMD